MILYFVILPFANITFYVPFPLLSPYHCLCYAFGKLLLIVLGWMRLLVSVTVETIGGEPSRLMLK